MNERQEQMIERLVQWIEARGLRAPAILLLEANKPLALFGGQALLFLQPLLGLVGPALGWPGGKEPAAEWAALLEDPAGMDRILERLETRQCPN
jgi:hypothetical protein